MAVQSADGRVNATAAAGVADPTTGKPMTVETPYLLASITKMHTAALIFQLSQRGLLDLNAPIGSYLPEALLRGLHVYNGTDYSCQIKVYQLVTQTSGLADYYEGKPADGPSIAQQLSSGNDRVVDMETVAAITRRLKPRFEPGARNEGRTFYSGTNYRLMGAIVEAVSGKPLVDNLQELIFDPLELANTYPFRADLPPNRRPATTYTGEQTLAVPQLLSGNLADGGLVSTVADSLTFLRSFLEGRLFDRSCLGGLMERWNGIFFPMQYGAGMMRIRMPRILSPFKPAPEFIGHSGSTGSFAYYCPDKAVYVAGTLNQRNAARRAVQVMMQAANLVSQA